MISVILPTDRDLGALGPALAALTPGLAAGALRDVILADSGAEPAIAEIAEACGAERAPGPAAPGPRLRGAAAAARGPWLLFLPEGGALSPDWPEAARRHIALRPGRAGWFAWRATGPAGRRLAARTATARALWFGLPRGAHGLLIEKTLYEALGGHAADGREPVRPLLRALGRRRLSPLEAAIRA